MIVGVETPETVDQFARVIGGIGAVTGVLGLVISFFGWDRRGVWRRRHASIAAVRAPLQEIDGAVDPGASPQAMLGLWSLGVQSALDELDSARGAIPYKRFRQGLETLHSELVTVRGTQAPTREHEISGEGMALNAQQRAALIKARAAMDSLKALEQKAAQKGVV